MAPLAIAAVLGGTLAGAFAITKLIKKKASGGTKPTPTTTSLLTGRAGDRTFEMHRLGPGFAWSVSGTRTGSGSDKVSGIAVATMLEFALSSNSADVVSMEIDKYALTVAQEGPMRWQWIVTSAGGAAPSSVGRGDSSSRGAALLSALGAIEPLTDWLTGLPSAQGATSAMAPMPITNAHGLTIAGTSIAVADLEQWIAYATPVVREQIGQGLTASQMLADFFGDATANLTLNGKPTAKVTADAQRTLNAIRGGTWVSVAEPDKVLAAGLVGSPYAETGKADRYREGTYVVRQQSGQWTWLSWLGGRGYDVDANANGVSPSQAKAIADAKTAIAAAAAQGGA